MTQATITDFNSSNGDNEWGYGQLFAILLRRRLWFFGGLLTVLVATVLVTIRSRPLYQSSMSILIQSSYRSKPLRNSVDSLPFTDPTTQTDTITQLEVLRSEKLLQLAVGQAQEAYPTLTVEELQGAFRVNPLYGADKTGKGQVATNVLQAIYVSDDPAKTEFILRTLLSVYQKYDSEEQSKRFNKGLEFINQQIPEIEGKVRESEAALQAFRQGENLIDPVQQAAIKEQHLEQTQRDRQALQAEYQQAFARYQSLKQQIASSLPVARGDAKLAESPRYQSLLNELQTIEGELSKQQQLLTPDHPALQELSLQLDQQKQRLAQEQQRVLGGSGSAVLGNQPIDAVGQLGRTDVGLANQLTQLESELAGLKARDDSLQATESLLTNELKQYPALIARYNSLQPEVEAHRATLEQLRNAQQELALKNERGVFKWEPVEEPKLGEQISPNVFRNLLLGGVVGVFIGILAVFLREALDDKVHNPVDLGGQIPLPLLGTVPILSRGDAREMLVPLGWNALQSQERTTPEMFQWQPLREALDLIYANIQLLKGNMPYKTLMVTSALPGEGKSTLALGLAISASRLDQRVLLIDADLRKPSLHEVFNLNNDQGLSTLLTGDIPEEEFRSTPQWVYMRWEEQEQNFESELVPTQTLPPADLSMDVLTTGPVSSDPVKLLSIDRIREVITVFQDSYDLIVLDSPPVLGLVDTIPVGQVCDGVVMVSRMDQVTRSELADAVHRLDKLNVIGLVANGVHHSSTHNSNKYLSA